MHFILKTEIKIKLHKNFEIKSILVALKYYVGYLIHTSQ